jgi:hypothetical protein
MLKVVKKSKPKERIKTQSLSGISGIDLSSQIEKKSSSIETSEG